VESVSNHDYNMIQALVMLVVGIFAFTNLVVDIVYAWLDPRIRYNRWHRHIAGRIRLQPFRRCAARLARPPR
jgi:hypothetical protein